MDTLNEFVVSSCGSDRIVMLRPPLPGQTLTADRAIMFAAWLVALVPGGEDKFTKALAAVLAT